jgi:hypothetical protein
LVGALRIWSGTGLAGFIGKAVAPKALGTPYVKERE